MKTCWILVSGHCPASTKEVQTLSDLNSNSDSGPTNGPIYRENKNSVKHSVDCPFNVNSETVCNKSSDPFSENSDDYLESSTTVPEPIKGDKSWFLIQPFPKFNFVLKD